MNGKLGEVIQKKHSQDYKEAHNFFQQRTPRMPSGIQGVRAVSKKES